jgi:hypothetical protein
MGDARPVLPNVVVAVLFHRNGGGLRVFNSLKVERRLNWQNRWPTGRFPLPPPEVKMGFPELTPAASLSL